MGLLSNMIEDRRAAEAQAIFAEQIGTQGQPGIADQGIGPQREIEPTGIFNLPVEQQATAAARIATATFGPDAGLSLLGSALEQKASLAANEQEFVRQEARQNQEFQTTRVDDFNKWNQEQALRVVTREEQAEAHLMKMAVGEQNFKFGQQSEARAIRNAEIAEVKLGRLEPAQRTDLIQTTDNLFKMQSNIQHYKPGYAFNTLSETEASIRRGALLRKTDKTDYDLNRLEFWRDIDSYKVYLLNQLSGAAITEAEYDRLSALLPTGVMDDKQIERNMRILHKELGNNLDIKARAADLGEFKDIRPLFSAGLDLPELSGGPPIAAPLPNGDPAPPPGFR